jgi:hypothetical protein
LSEAITWNGEGVFVVELGDDHRARDFHHRRSRLRYSAYQLPSAAITENLRSAVADPVWMLQPQIAS